MSTINRTPAQHVNWPVDFAWYQAGATPSLLSMSVGGLNYPYGLSTVATTVTTPANHTTPFSITVADASSFVGGSGVNASNVPFAVSTGQYPFPISTLYIYTSATNWVLIGYTVGPASQAPITGNTFNYCFVIDGYNGGISLPLNAGTQIYDPRWATTLAPLSTISPTSVMLDAIDSTHLGLPNSKNANIVAFHWDLGNGLEADGPVIETQYWYTGQLNVAGVQTASPSQISITMTAIDVFGYTYIVSHPVLFSHLYTSVGGVLTPGYLDT